MRKLSEVAAVLPPSLRDERVLEDDEHGFKACKPKILLMASSSSNKRKSRYDVGMDSPDAFKSLARMGERCQCCLKFRAELAEIGIMSFKQCGGCRSAFYCSSACQIVHWKKEHKKECKKRANDRAAVREVAPGPRFVADLEQWERSSQMLLIVMVAVMLQEEAARVSRPGAPVTPEDLADKYCGVADAEYVPGSPLPFQIGKDCNLMSFDGLAEVPGMLKHLSDSNAEAVEGGIISCDFIPLHMIVRVAGISRVITVMAPRDRLRGNGNDSDLGDTAVANLVDIINAGFKGAGL